MVKQEREHPLNSKRLVLIGAALSATLLLAGCEFSCSIGGNTVSSEELDKQVRIAYEDETGILLTSIDCEEADSDIGSPINCLATNENDLELTIEGEVTDLNSDTDRIRFDWQVVSASAPGVAFEVAAARSLRNQTGAVISDVTCPQKITLEAGTIVDCTGVDSQGNERELVLTLTDRKGAFDVNLRALDATPQDSTS